MKSKRLVSVLTISVLAIMGIGVVSAYTPLGTPVAIGGQGEIVFTPGPLLDDFASGSSINRWGTLTGAFSSSSATPAPSDEICTMSYPVDPDIARAGCLRLDYNVDKVNSFAGYYSVLGGASLASPVAYTSVSFYVKGAVGGEFFKIQIKNKSTTKTWDAREATYYYRNTAAVYITDYLDGGVTTAWQKVTIPFSNFANLDGWGSMAEFVVVFENSQNSINGSPTHGAIYIDNITFETSSISSVRVDHFGDKIGTCALGGNMGTAAGDGTIGYSYSSASGDYPVPPNGAPNGLRLTYNVTTEGSWGAAYILFGGGNAGLTAEPDVKPEKMGWIAVPQNFSAYTTLTVWLKGTIENIQVEMQDSSGKTKAVEPIRITNSWQRYEIPLSLFTDVSTGAKDLNKAALKQLTFVIKNSWAGPNKTGTLFIDSVQFKK